MKTPQVPKFTRRFSVSLTEEQYSRLSEAVEASGIKLSELVRRRVNGVEIPQVHVGIIQGLKNLCSELARQGGLIKHIYKIQPQYSKETAAVLDAWQKYFTQAFRDYETIRKQIESEVSPL